MPTKEKNKETSPANKSTGASGEKPKATLYISKARAACEILRINTAINNIHMGSQELLCDSMMTKL